MFRRLTQFAVALVLVGGCAGPEPSAGRTPPPSPSTPAITAPLSVPQANPTREAAMLAAFGRAVGQWNTAATGVLGDMTDQSLDIPGFGSRTEAGRLEMRSAALAMPVAIAAEGVDRGLAGALSQLAASYKIRIEALDDLADAATRDDMGGVQAALIEWDRGISLQKVAVPVLLGAARPYLTGPELESWKVAASGQ